jgi:hypothetical protein
MSTMSYTHMFTGLPQSDAELAIRHKNYQNYYMSNPNCGAVTLSSLTHGPLGNPSDFHIGYSDGDASTLDETALVESAGIGTAPWGMSGGIDWNCDGDAVDSPANYNITGKGFYPGLGSCGQEATQIDEEVTDHDDWGNLELYHRTHFLSGVWPNAGLPFECAFP